VSDRPVAEVAALVRAELADTGAPWQEPAPGTFLVTLAGEHRQATTCALVVGAHTLLVHAFVMRRPDERADAVHRWLLERNLRLFAVSWAVDRAGDLHLVARLPHAAVAPGEVDRLLGTVLGEADGAFDTLLGLGFASAIRREWAWRTARGEPTRNLSAFRHLLDDPPP
jgi:hypothetical protein